MPTDTTLHVIRQLIRLGPVFSELRNRVRTCTLKPLSAYIVVLIHNTRYRQEALAVAKRYLGYETR